LISSSSLGCPILVERPAARIIPSTWSLMRNRGTLKN